MMMSVTAEVLNFDSQLNVTLTIIIFFFGGMACFVPLTFLWEKSVKWTIILGTTLLVVFIGSLILVAQQIPKFSDKQVTSFITWAEEDHLLSITGEQARHILEVQRGENEYKNRYKESDSAPLLTPVKDVYGNKVDVSLIKTGDNTWVLKQTIAQPVPAPIVETNK